MYGVVSTKADVYYLSSTSSNLFQNARYLCILYTANPIANITDVTL